ncbi:GTPase Era [Acetilactobacillus jinshanensis]|uniref:GTPase Era n=1 Tax=Acetilactobacillus jinshanensis TaxID=1720083 RepID=A0A4P6ZK10_9LACO|nr:GTPase Era [Acetilactobacillus jinshanensis]QBP17984.1 GTPase Era [Acetilactobacillus jinshanensis]URL60846.1 GTPase Era [uncultured bacterium]
MKLDPNYKSGFIAIIGRPNVGKSTLLNRMIGQKVAIMTDKPQTTRNKIQGVYTDKGHQIVFVDTPGVLKPKNKLSDFMEDSAMSALKGVDGILFMINALQPRGAGDNFIIKQLKQVKVPVYLVINKIDQVNPNKLLPIMDSYKNAMNWTDVFPISALQGNNVDELLDDLKKHLPKGPQYYPSDQVTDHPERFIVSELIREKIFELTRQEIPYSVAVQVQSMNSKVGNKLLIRALIIVERPGQKGIIIGRRGSMLKKIGTLARQDIERLLGTGVYLKLWVKVYPHWRDNKSILNQLGYKRSDY